MTAVELLADLTRRGIRLEAAGGKLRFWPASQPAEVIDTMHQHKPELIGLLRAAPPLESSPRCRRCGLKHYRDVPLHGGQSVRRDCGQCGVFWDFVVWYGSPSDN